MERIKTLYLGLLLVASILAFSVVYRTATQTISPTLTRMSKQEVYTVGDEIVANFQIHNPDDTPHTYTYAVYLDDKESLKNNVTIKPKQEFQFGAHYRALEPGELRVAAAVAQRGTENLIKNITYYVTINDLSDLNGI